MKIRCGFVSNSSSSSFVVRKHGLTELQNFAIKEHCKLANFIKHNVKPSDTWIYDYVEGWYIDEDEDSYYCETSMDNFPLDEFLEQFGITLEKRWHS